MPVFVKIADSDGRHGEFTPYVICKTQLWGGIKRKVLGKCSVDVWQGIPEIKQIVGSNQEVSYK